MTPLWVSRYVHGVQPSRAIPIECGQRSIATNTARMTQVDARPAYNHRRLRCADAPTSLVCVSPDPGSVVRDPESELNANIQSHSQTMIGAVTIVCLLPIPSAHEAIAAVVHTRRALGFATCSAARIEQYRVRRKKSPINTSVR